MCWVLLENQTNYSVGKENLYDEKISNTSDLSYTEEICIGQIFRIFAIEDCLQKQ